MILLDSSKINFLIADLKVQEEQNSLDFSEDPDDIDICERKEARKPYDWHPTDQCCVCEYNSETARRKTVCAHDGSVHDPCTTSPAHWPLIIRRIFDNIRSICCENITTNPVHATVN